MATEEKPPSVSVKFKHREGPQFRIVHVDGIYGGPTPAGLLYAAVYTQLPPLPSEVTQEVIPDGSLGKELSKVSDMAIERRLEVGLIMDLNMCKALRDWLNKQVGVLEGFGKTK